MTTIKERKKTAREIRAAFQGKPARRVRVKTAEHVEMDAEFDRLMAEHKLNGAAHLASAKAKMGSK